ncbi:MAG: hypothetical protein E6H80_13270 [Betaproteobacteria bacterium]|nr:MAG: hypothetical protein E6H80_13270 [Betaproteobacteria bacterium]
MRLKFSREVRKSIADELKKISTFGGLGLGVLGYSMTNPLIMLGAFVCWTICQIVANILLAIED